MTNTNTALTVNPSRKPVKQLPATRDVDIAHLSTGLFSVNLLTYENVTQLAKTLDKLLKGKEFPGKDGITRWHIVRVLAVAHRVKMRVYEVQEEVSE